VVKDFWQTLTIGELCDEGGGSVQTGPFGSQLHAEDYVADGVPFVMPTNLGENRIVENEIARISVADTERLSRYRLRTGDIIYGRRGDIGRRALVTKREDGWMCGSGCIRIRFGEAEVEPRFVSFYLGQNQVKELILARAVGSTMPNLNSQIIRSIPISFPPLIIQRRIADILGALDDKIECNRRINLTLEAMAQALYKHWFVDSSDSEYQPITDFIQVDPTVEIPRNSEMPFVEMKALPTWSMSVTDVARRRFAGGSKFKNGDTLLAAITPSLENGKTAFVDFLEDDEAGWGSTEFIVLRAKQGVSPQFVYCSARDEDLRTRAIKSMVGSSGRQRVRRDFLDRFEIKAFDGQTMTGFHERTLSWFKQIRANIKENQTLTRTRDYLLPKLLSGEVEVRNG
jgi:type I restriction enzyme S subunit